MSALPHPRTRSLPVLPGGSKHWYMTIGTGHSAMIIILLLVQRWD